jgi:hypothetical protein
VVLDTAGQQVAVLDRDVQRYTWCCLGERIAAVVGPYYEGGPGFIPEGVWLFDVSDRGERSLPVPGGTRSVAWAAFESSLYFKLLARRDTAGVWRFRWPGGPAARTDLKDITLSPSGRYYLYYNLRDEREPIGWHLIDRASRRELPLPDTALGAVQGWAFDRGDYLLLARGRRRTPPPKQARPQAVAADVEIVEQVLYDVPGRRVAARVAGRAVPRSAALGGSLLVERAGALRVVGPPP